MTFVTSNVILSIYIFEMIMILFISSLQINFADHRFADPFDTMDTLGIKINHRHLKDSIHVHSIMDGMEEVMFCRYTERSLLHIYYPVLWPLVKTLTL